MKREEKILVKSQEQRAESQEQWAVSLIAVDLTDNNFTYRQLMQTAIDKKQFQQFLNKYNSFNSHFGGWETSALAIRAAGAVFNN